MALSTSQALTVFATTMFASPETLAQSCDRECLEAFLDTYVDAVFRIEGGLIGPVESVLHPVPYGMTSGWSEWRDAMSSEPHR